MLAYILRGNFSRDFFLMKYKKPLDFDPETTRYNSLHLFCFHLLCSLSIPQFSFLSLSLRLPDALLAGLLNLVYQNTVKFRYVYVLFQLE